MKQNEISNLVKISQKVVGLKQSLASIINDTARCVIVSNDCDDFIASKIELATHLHKIPVYKFISKKELGSLCEIDVSASVVAILKSHI